MDRTIALERLKRAAAELGREVTSSGIVVGASQADLVILAKQAAAGNRAKLIEEWDDPSGDHVMFHVQLGTGKRALVKITRDGRIFRADNRDLKLLDDIQALASG